MNHKIVKLKAHLILFVSFVTFLSCKEKTEQQTQEEKFYRVEVAKVGETSLNKQFTYSGFVEPKLTVPLSFLVPGTVVSVNVEEGDKVYKGQVLATLNKVTASNTYQGTLATLKQAEDAYRRLKSVYDKGSLPEIKMQDAISKLEQAKSANQVALQNLSNCTLKAPKSGFVGSRNVEVGSSIIPGNPVVDLVTLDEVYVRISVPENEINRVHKGQKASITISALGSTEFEGEIEKVGVIADRFSKTYEVKIVIPNKNLSIKSGMACDVEIALDPVTNKLAIPYRAVIKDEENNNFVFVVNPETNAVTKKSIKLGPFMNNDIEVIDGLNKGDIIVTEGQHKLTENEIVSY